MLRTYQAQIKLFEFSQDTNKEELKIRKNNVPLQWFCYHSVRFYRSPMFTNKATIFLDDRLYRKISACC